MAAKKMNVARPNTPRLAGGSTLPHSNSGTAPRPMNGLAGSVGPKGPVSPNVKPGTPGAKPGTPATPGARPGAGAQRPGMQKPGTPPPPKVTVNAPPKSLAPKRK